MPLAHFVLVFVEQEGLQITCHWIPSFVTTPRVREMLVMHNLRDNNDIDVQVANDMYDFLKDNKIEREIGFERRDREIENVFVHRCHC